MDKIALELEAVTATFLHVEPHGRARWRPAAFRGLSRWWFRAVAGAALDLGAVREREKALFGSADSPSPVVFRLMPDAGGASAPALVNPRQGEPSEKRYTAEREALPPGARARLELSLVPRSGAAGSDSELAQAYAALWVALHFGGVGQRSRRGAGSLRMSVLSGNGTPAPVSVADAENLATKLAEGLRGARQVLGAAALSRRTGSEADFPILHPECAQSWVVAGPRAGNEVDARRHLMDIRRRLPGHTQGAREAEFGLVGREERLASPVWVRVAHWDRQRTLFVVTVLRHRGADRARWDRVQEFVSRLGQGAPVDLGGAER